MGIRLADGERLMRALQSIYGIGPTRAKELCFAVGASPSMKASDLHQFHLAQLNEIIQQRFPVESKLRSIEQGNIERLKRIRCFRGLKHNRKS